MQVTDTPRVPPQIANFFKSRSKIKSHPRAKAPNKKLSQDSGRDLTVDRVNRPRQVSHAQS
ncbi:hypothetical protein CCM_03778 [Cordyceps militaris CM01]|uniref:Uncharacterized protein n=1 Tax=Cordyceps militaris (strain CM01) TaxID=983644 RepID=G3JGI8_CORMM|nr:uncharacterized protein CCM_03778 [Cordyceps militaris CM01]EGX92405.1 hypothetical protein CCM_03778 [Cordyceps militaris CM01]